MNFERFIHSGFYQASKRLFDLLVLNMLWLLTSILTGGILLVSSSLACFMITKDMLYDKPNQLFYSFFMNIKRNWSFSWRLTVILFITLMFFYLYGISIYHFVFVQDQKFFGFLYIGLGSALLIFMILVIIHRFIFESYFPKQFSMMYACRACILIIKKKKLMTFFLLIDFAFWVIVTYFTAPLGLLITISACIYSLEAIARKHYEEIYRDEETRKVTEKRN